MCICTLQQTHVYFLAVSAEMAYSNDIPVATSTLILRSWFLIPLSDERNQTFLLGWLILGLGWEIYNMSLEHFVITGKKKKGQKIK